MTTYKEYAEQHPTIQIDERLYAKEIPTDLVTILESHNGISDEVQFQSLTLRQSTITTSMMTNNGLQCTCGYKWVTRLTRMIRQK